jgi:hypothetical protein
MQGITDALKTRGETRKIWLYVEQFGASNNIKKRMGKSFQQKNNNNNNRRQTCLHF